MRPEERKKKKGKLCSNTHVFPWQLNLHAAAVAADLECARE